MRIRLNAGDVIRISGPANFTVTYGKIFLLGAVYGEGDSVIVHKYRSYGILAVKDSAIDVRLGEGGHLSKVNPAEEVVSEWLNIAEHLWSYYTSEGKLKAVIIGPVESGKTSAAAFISNYFISKGQPVYLLEGDIGQEDLAIPGTVALSLVDEVFLWQRELTFDALRFVGCITPHICKDTLLSAINDLTKLAKEDYPLIINTDGWVSDESALMFKAELIRWIRPTHVVVTDEDLYRFVRSSALGSEAIYLPPPKAVRERDRNARRYLRKELYRKYFERSRVVELSLKDTPFIKSRLFGGIEPSKDEISGLIPEEALGFRVLRVSLIGNSVYILVDKGRLRSIFFKNRKIIIVSPRDLKGCIVGILNSEYSDVGAGIIESIKDLDGEVSIKVRTPYEGDVGGLIAGYIKLGRDYQEVGGERGCII